MLEFITAPLNTFFNWGLAKLNLNAEHKRQQTVQLKKLLYNLLELKAWVEKEVFIDRDINKLLNIYADEVGQKIPEGGKYVKDKQPWMVQFLKKKFLSTDKFTSIAGNIENVLKELSEIDPLFAFQLSGVYNITEKMEIVKGYLRDLPSEIEIEPSNNDVLFDDMLRPKIINDIYIQLQKDVLEVAKMIDEKTYEKVSHMNQQVNTPIDEGDFKRFMAPLILKIQKKIAAENNN